MAVPTPAPLASPTLKVCRVGTYLPPGSVVSVIGDSYTTGGGRERWPDAIARRTGWDVQVDGADGSSYQIGGYTGHDFSGPKFPDQVVRLAPQHPDLVIIMGSRNDMNHIEPPYPTIVQDTLRAIRRAVPLTPVLVVGSFWPNSTPPDSLFRIHAILKAAAARISCSSFLDPIAEGWFAHPEGLIGPDGEHPTVAGLRHVADLYQRDLTRLGYL